MSFFSNFQSDKCPGAITGNPLNGLCERVCIQAQKIFDAGIRQVQVENYNLELDIDCPQCPLTFVSARSTSDGVTLTNVSVDRLHDKQGCARVQATVNIPVEVVYTDSTGAEQVAAGTVSVNEDVLLFVPAPSIMPFKVVAEASAVATEGSFADDSTTVTMNACASVILKIAIDVELLVPSYGYCAIPPAQDYSKEVCQGYFELPLYPQSRSCACKGT